MPQAASQSTTTRARNHLKTDKLRARMERAIERLLAALDALDVVEEDLEDGHDAEAVNEDGGDINDEGEATLGWTEEGSRIGYLGTTYAGEAELQNEDGTDNPDDAQSYNTPAERDGVLRARQTAREMLRDRGLFIGRDGVAHFIEGDGGYVRVSEADLLR